MGGAAGWMPQSKKPSVTPESSTGRRGKGREGGRGGRGKHTVTAGWATGGAESVICLSLLPVEQHVQDERSKRPQTGEHEGH